MKILPSNLLTVQLSMYLSIYISIILKNTIGKNTTTINIPPSFQISCIICIEYLVFKVNEIYIILNEYIKR